MDNPFFSIIIPIYNVEDYLERCIISVLSQTFTNFELILVNDGSIDRSGKICESFTNDQRVFYLQKENGGSSSARNEALDRVKGEFVLFLDADDYWSTESILHNIYKHIIEYKNDVILYGCKDVFINSGNSYISRGNYNLKLINNGNKSKTLSYLNESGNFPGAAWIMAVKYSIIKNRHLRFPIGVSAEDIGWVNDILVSCNSIGAINDIVYIYHKNRPGQITSKATIKGCLGMILSIKDWMKNPARPEYPIISQRMSHLYLVLLMHFFRLDKTNRRDLKRKVIECGKILRSGTYLDNITYCIMKLIGPFYMGSLIRFAYKFLNEKNNSKRNNQTY